MSDPDELPESKDSEGEDTVELEELVELLQDEDSLMGRSQAAED